MNKYCPDPQKHFKTKQIKQKKWSFIYKVQIKIIKTMVCFEIKPKNYYKLLTFPSVQMVAQKKQLI